ncbi:hypothetical protein EDD85DRAFT_947684 [Armillaria nabsnona]|nr:hypothetical protein EDD85DRAFT_947684 [Armillaria nabsnona]
MFMVSGPNNQIAAGVALVIWDHCLTFDDEVTVIWASFKGPTVPKVIYIMNRYFTEAVLLYTAYVFTGLGGPAANKVSPWRSNDNLISISELGLCTRFLVNYYFSDHFCWHITILDYAARLSTVGSQANHAQSAARRIYCLHDRIVGSFCQDCFDPFEDTRVAICSVPDVPKTAPFLMGILLLFDLFVVSASFYNALEEPRRRESEVFYSLRRDGAKIYSIVSLLWVLLLITSLFAKMSVYFPILILSWSVAANLTSRMHLRIESLRQSNNAHTMIL